MMVEAILYQPNDVGVPNKLLGNTIKFYDILIIYYIVCTY